MSEVFILFIAGLFGAFIGGSIAGVWYLNQLKKNSDEKSEDEINSNIRNTISSYLELQEYHNVVRDSFLKMKQQKEQIQVVLKNAIGKNEHQVTESFQQLYDELDEIMNHFLERQAEMEKKLFDKTSGD